MCHAALKIQLSDFTQNFINRRSVWINRNTNFTNATLYLYLSWIAIIGDWTLEIPINKVSQSSHQLAKIGHVENGADICFYFSSFICKCTYNLLVGERTNEKKTRSVHLLLSGVPHTKTTQCVYGGSAFCLARMRKKWRSNFLINVHKC